MVDIVGLLKVFYICINSNQEVLYFFKGLKNILVKDFEIVFGVGYYFWEFLL